MKQYLSRRRLEIRSSMVSEKIKEPVIETFGWESVELYESTSLSRIS
jgi:hypothetical protein